MQTTFAPDSTAEEREIEYELTLDASGSAHTDTVHDVAVNAICGVLEPRESGPAGDLMVNAATAALIAGNAALNALDDAGHLIAEGTIVHKRWQAMSDDGEVVTDEMDEDQLHEWMTTRGLRDGEHIVYLRTLSSVIPREATRPQPAPVFAPAVPGDIDEVNF